MQNGNAKFNMFEDFETLKVAPTDAYDMYGEEEVEVVSVTMKTDTKKKYAAAVVARSQEEFDECVESFHYETLVHPTTGESYEVKVTVLKPEINPMELLRPAYAYSTNFS